MINVTVSRVMSLHIRTRVFTVCLIYFCYFFLANVPLSLFSNRPIYSARCRSCAMYMMQLEVKHC